MSDQNAEIDIESVEIDVVSVTSSLQGKMPHSLNMSPQCCIFETPQILKRHNEKAYSPDAFSIGPFHHARASLKYTEGVKLKYLQALINRSDPNPTRKLREMIKKIAGVEGEARGCYFPPIGLPRKEFVEILVLDACFVIELFLRHTNEELRDTDDPVFSMSFMLQLLYHDLCLLENQIPWFVLDYLFHMTNHSENVPLVQLALKFFDSIFQSTSPLSSNKPLNSLHGSKHILDLLRNSLVSSTAIITMDKTSGWQPIPSARSLVEAGIKITRAKSSNILDIKFHKNGVLEIPPLLIQETTETVFRNLIGFEQCQSNCRPVITSYAILFDNLITTAKDVDILLENEILDNWLNLEDATRFFNKLYLDTYVKEYYFLQFNLQINKYCNGPCHRLRAYLVRNRLLTPVGIVSQVAAFILNGCTIIQTFFKK